MTTPTQCGTSLVRWSGDTGPYHLLLTPTAFKEYGYNVWIESIPDGTNAYNLTIQQPAGLQYLLTVWGSSGIQYAATTDVMTVGSPITPGTTCFLSDDAILNLYTFSFNLTSESGNSPPQCSNISLTWPSSLESNVTSDYVPMNQITTTTQAARRSIPSPQAGIEPNLPVNIDSRMDLDIFEERDASSSEHAGNTTHPPTMFGIIPLGNSFSIPITYSRTSKYAKYLPESALSDNPTTFTSQGTTHLNWTVDMAKGTRFILVAGIGSQEKWASGGSSTLFTVGQGGTGCVGSEQNGGGVPSITATSDGPTSTAGDSSPPPPNSSPVKRTVIASVLSVIGTLAIVALIFMCRRARQRRRANVVVAGGSSKKGGNTKGGIIVNQYTTDSDTPLDLIASRSEGQVIPPRLSPLVFGQDDTHDNNGNTNAIANGNITPISPINPFEDTPYKQPFIPGPSRSTTVDESGTGTGTWSSIASPIRGNTIPRGSSQDALLQYTEGFTSMRHDSPSNIRNDHRYDREDGTYQSNQGLSSGTYQSSRSGPLHLHNAQIEGDEEEEEDVSDLKRETMAYLGEGTSNTRGMGGRTGAQSVSSAPPGRRRRQQTQHSQEPEIEFRIHRDAGRVRPPTSQQQKNNVMELPPRYDEVNWEEERQNEREELERQTR
ncbi:uncharacterized protein L201_007028 [Kwoniella dendrophila CBS 6074]|uniref:Dystroglycan-type cadherin-like domain-containing protein n=1 Tax=Kwoniella dendrophila CBS 6074 TaxID=1295534 RepID=A0AAX4K4I2_9TREE